MIALILSLYGLAAAGLFVYGLNCYVLAALHGLRRRQALGRLERHRRDHGQRVPDDALPGVTVQLPVYNERFVVERLLDSVAAFDWPRDRLRIQVLDDSTDDTSEVVAGCVRRQRAAGLTIEHLRRADRRGFKAGALAEGLAATPDEFVAIFDADFVPQPDFLRRCMPFLEQPDVGLVQARWGHLNRDEGWLTRLQALAVDGHFGIEQGARCWSGLLLNFNGTAGIWRRRAIEEAGGWTADTLTEDLDLSYRAQLKGWRIEYLVDVEVPAELPADLLAFKSQQRRWAQGSIQTARKLLGTVFAAPLPLWTRCQAFLHLTHYLVHPLMLLVAVLGPLLLHAGETLPATPLFVSFLALGAAGPSTLYVVSQRTLRGSSWLAGLRALPFLMLVGCGLAVSNTRAIVRALTGRNSAFVRTPKRGGATGRERAYALPADPGLLVEVGLGLWAGWALWASVGRDLWPVAPFMSLYAGGFLLVAARSFWEGLAARPLPRRSAARGQVSPEPTVP